MGRYGADLTFLRPFFTFRYHTAGRAGNTYNSHHTESTVDVPCNAAARYVRVRSADSSQLVICELFVSQGDQPYTGTEVRGVGYRY